MLPRTHTKFALQANVCTAVQYCNTILNFLCDKYMHTVSEMLQHTVQQSYATYNNT